MQITGRLNQTPVSDLKPVNSYGRFKIELFRVKIKLFMTSDLSQVGYHELCEKQNELQSAIRTIEHFDHPQVETYNRANGIPLCPICQYNANARAEGRRKGSTQ